MKALTLTQPWATLVAIRAKTIETRSWATPYRGPVAIHAAKGLRPVGGMAGFNQLCGTEPFNSVLSDYANQLISSGRILHTHVFPLGAIVAVAELVDCVSTNLWDRTDWAPAMHTNEWAFGDYSADRWMWRLTNIRQLPTAVEVRGALGLWNWTPPEGWEVPFSASPPANTQSR